MRSGEPEPAGTVHRFVNFRNIDIVVRDPAILNLILLRSDAVNILQVERNVLQVVLHFGVTDPAEEVLGVDLALPVLRFVVVEAEAVHLDDVLADVTFFA